jgi:hypothetical protein
MVMDEKLLYTERQPFRLVIFFVFVLVSLYVSGWMINGGYLTFYTEVRFYIILLVFLSPAFFWGIMKIEVYPTTIHVLYGLAGTKKKTIEIKDIKAIQLVTIKWLKDFRFIGITYGKDTGEIGYFVRYGKGLKLTTTYGTVFIGASKAEKLHAVLKGLMKKS